ncbi:OmpA family protein [Psychroserpens luteolus]|uniref:OmpA family protein n=1 Tax=Psychroserpens luteolus TaxID=2855840 RepID=UPI001E509284|nr:OmpA family protein [Psychroserpens luteolus]MCD2258382.1 OmpA family protein [Psychroserpens luteolus]
MAQNLVLNPSFESQKTDKCVFYIGGFNSKVSNWSTPNMASTDFFDKCSSNAGLKNYNGYQKPKTGDAYAGMYFYTDKNYREYVQGELSETLKKGEKYKLMFYLSLADQSSYALKDIQILMTEEQLKPCYHSNSCEKVIKPSKVTKKKFKLYSNTEGIYFSNKESWMEYSFEFIAEGYENYFSIGNFYRNSKTLKQEVLSSSEFYFSYYYIDEVSIESLEKKALKKDIQISDESSIKTNEIYIFKNVLFDFDKSELLEASIEELNQLYKHLSKNLDLSIEIYGHTDNVGLDSRNKELSKQRAKAVADYLISQGLDESKILSFGFGSSKPILTNDTEEGRQQNRRVEFKIIQN